MRRFFFGLALLLLVIAGGLFYVKSGNTSLLRASQESATSSAAMSTSWKGYVRQVINNRADISITSGTLFLQLTPVDQDAWHIVIKPNTEKTATTTIVSKKMNINITQETASISSPLPADFSLDTTISTTQLNVILSSLPDKK